MRNHIRILLIEPDTRWSDRLRRLDPVSLKIDTAHTHAAAPGERYDVVVLDLALGSGHNTCRRWRRDGVSAPIVVIGRPGMEDEIVECLRSGATDFLGAGGTPADLVSRLHVLSKRMRTSSRHRWSATEE